MSFPLLPVVSLPTEIDAVSVVGQVLTTVQSIDKYFLNDFPAHVDVFVDLRALPVDPIDVLNAGVKQIVVDKAKFDELTSSGIPEWRLVLANSASFPKEAAILVTKPLSDDDFNRLSDDGNRPIYLEKSFTEEEAIDSAKKGYIPVIPARNLANKTSVVCYYSNLPSGPKI